MPSEHTREPSLLLRQRRVASSFRFDPQSLQLPDEPCALRSALHNERPVPGPTAIVRKAQERECFGPTLTRSRASMGGEPPELDQSRFLLMQRQGGLSKAFLEIGPHPPCIILSLKAHHEIIAIPHDDHGAHRMALAPLMNPKIENVVKKDVREQRADSRTLRSSRVRPFPLISLHHAGAEPTTNELQD